MIYFIYWPICLMKNRTKKVSCGYHRSHNISKAFIKSEFIYLWKPCSTRRIHTQKKIFFFLSLSVCRGSNTNNNQLWLWKINGIKRKIRYTIYIYLLVTNEVRWTHRYLLLQILTLCVLSSNKFIHLLPILIARKFSFRYRTL